jgi:hypothetical protein
VRHEQFRYLVAGATFLLVGVGVFAVWERDQLDDLFDDSWGAAAIAAAVGVSVVVGWWVHSAAMFICACLTGFDSAAMRRTRCLVKNAIVFPQSLSGQGATEPYSLDLSALVGGGRRLNQPPKGGLVTLTPEEFETLFDPYHLLLRVRFSHRWRFRDNLKWLFVEHVHDLAFFRGPEADYARALASSMHVLPVTLVAAACGATGGGLAVLLLRWGEWWAGLLAGVLGLLCLVFLAMGWAYGFWMCKKEYEARLMLDTLLLEVGAGRVALRQQRWRKRRKHEA